MADLKGRIIVEDQSKAAFASATKSAQQFAKETQNAGKNATGAFAGVKPALADVDSAAQTAMAGLGGLAKTLGVIGVAFAAMEIGNVVVDLGKVGAASQKLQSSFSTLASGVGASSQVMLDALRSASGGAISDYNLMLSANRAMLLGVADSAQEMTALMEVASRRGATMGLDMTTAFDNLVTGLGRASPDILDNLGITLDAVEVYEDYAKSVGKVASELEEADKKQALVNLVMQEATGAGVAQVSGFEQMAASTANFKAELGMLVAVPVSEFFKTLAGAMQGANAFFSEARIQQDFEASAYGKLTAAMQEYNAAREEMARYSGADAPLGLQAMAQEQLAAATQQVVELGKAYNDVASQTSQPLINIDAVLSGSAAILETNEALAALPAGTRNVEETTAAVNEQSATLKQASAAWSTYSKSVQTMLETSRLMGSINAFKEFAAQSTAIEQAFQKMGWSSAQITAVMQSMRSDQIAALTDVQMAAGTVGDVIAEVFAAAMGSASQSVASGAAYMVGAFGQVQAAVANVAANVSRVLNMGGVTAGNPNAPFRPGGALSPSIIGKAQGGQGNANAVRGGDSAGKALQETAGAAALASRNLSLFGASASGVGPKLVTLGGAAGSAASALNNLPSAIQGMLQSVPGLFGTSEMTAEQMERADLGLPNNFADNYLRRLTDEVMNGINWEGVDIQDAAARIGMDPNAMPQAILSEFTRQWKTSELFANPQNLELIDKEAVKQALAQQQASQQGKLNIMSMFGLDVSQQQAELNAIGAEIASAIGAGITPENVPDAGPPVASAVSSDIGAQSSQFNAVGAAMAEAVHAGYRSRLGSLDWSTPTPTVPGGGGGGGAGAGPPAAAANAVGRSFWSGGWAWVGEAGAELVYLPRSTSIYSSAESKRVQGDAAPNVIVNATVASGIDVNVLAYKVADVLRRRAH